MYKMNSDFNSNFTDIPYPQVNRIEPFWINKLDMTKSNLFIEMKSNHDLFETILNIYKYKNGNYLVLFDDFDLLLQFLIGFVNVMTISELYVYKFNYLKFAFPYINYLTNNFKTESSKSIILTTKNKIKEQFLDVTTIYTFDSDKIYDTKCNIHLTTSRFMVNTIKTFPDTFKLRSHKISILFTDNIETSLINFMVKYNHRKLLLCYCDITFKKMLSDYNKIDYDSDYEDDHIRNNECLILSNTINKYNEIEFSVNEINILVNADELTCLNKDKQVLFFNDYKQKNHLMNLLTSIEDNMKAVDIVISTTLNKLLKDDLINYVNFTGKKIHYINECKNDETINDYIKLHNV